MVLQLGSWLHKSSFYLSLLMHSPALLKYCDGFKCLPLSELSCLTRHDKDSLATSWWSNLLSQGLAGMPMLQSLSQGLPQLLLHQVPGVSRSQRYQQLVRNGQHLGAIAVEHYPSGWLQPSKLECRLVDHMCGIVPVLTTSCRSDFELMVRAFAYRAEPVQVNPSVHGIAVDGLIHWHLAKNGTPLPKKIRLVILHEAPYGSLPASEVPGHPSETEWLKASSEWRLEHELAHLATRHFWGTMRLNLFDELVADGMGMVKALGMFDATLFLQSLGIKGCSFSVPKTDAPRWKTYVQHLDECEQAQALEWLCQRAQEVEQGFMASPSSFLGDQYVLTRFHWLSSQRLDKTIKSPRLG
jgi:hypothetical protein